ncbi:MAG: type II toxin-antitoxin system RelE/ParE family toxin [Verrucomicrobia bacterium]|nr:type II toxin-antitoxin system RelE/ParE family toxin [Verrucomicrobiota bacterium]
MKYVLLYRPEVVEDLACACEWYETQSPGLRARFLADYAARLEFIRHSAEVPRVVFNRFRRALLKHFPFAVWYEVEDKKALVLFVSDCRQDPGKVQRILGSR